MPRNKPPVSELGTIYAHGTEFRAHVQFRNDTGEQKHILGPSRGSGNEAQKDLDQIRAAGGVGATREESLKIMAAEARRIKMSAEYQSQIQETIQRRVSMETIDESDYEDERSDNSVPEWMQEYPSEEDSPEESSQPARPILTPLEATAELTKFRPIISKPSDLQASQPAASSQPATSSQPAAASQQHPASSTQPTILNIGPSPATNC